MSRLLRIFCAHANNLQINSNRHALLNVSQYGQAQQRSALMERNFTTNYVLCNKTELTEARTDKGNKKQSSQGNKITLLAQNQAVTITTLEEAVKLAKRRDLHLVQVQEMDNKTQRPVYKLVKAAELLESELEDAKEAASAEKNKSTQKKSEKSLTMGSRIAEHDLQSRIKNISKWLSKQHEVRILLQANNTEDMSNCERIAKTIEQSLKEPTLIGKIVQKRTKGSHMKFTIVPVQQGIDNKIQTKPS